jgi:hypothetical protein
MMGFITAKRLLTATVLSVVACSLGSTDVGAEKAHSLVLQLAPSQNAVTPGVPVWKAGSAVFVLVTAINNSDRTVHYALTSPWFDWGMSLRDNAGNPVPETEAFLKIKKARQNPLFVTSRNILVTLKPHETSQDAIEISYAYDLTKAGEYFLQVRREFPEVGKGPVESNCLELKIEP